MDNLHGDFGQSIHYKRPVADILLERLPWSLWIMGSTLALSLLLGVALALLCVRRPWADRALYPVLSALAEVPPFLTGVLLLFLVAARAAWIPLSGAYTPFAQYDGLWQRLGDILVHSLMPVCALTLVTVPKLFFTARASFFTILGRPYLTSARAKGLTAGRIRTAYILRNAATPSWPAFSSAWGAQWGAPFWWRTSSPTPALAPSCGKRCSTGTIPCSRGVPPVRRAGAPQPGGGGRGQPPAGRRGGGAMRRKWLVPLLLLALLTLCFLWGSPDTPPGPAPVGGSLEAPPPPTGSAPTTWGSDIYAQISAGFFRSLGIGLAAAAFTFAVGGGLGILAGFAGGWADALISFLIQVLLAIPRSRS